MPTRPLLFATLSCTCLNAMTATCLFSFPRISKNHIQLLHSRYLPTSALPQKSRRVFQTVAVPPHRSLWQYFRKCQRWIITVIWTTGVRTPHLTQAPGHRRRIGLLLTWRRRTFGVPGPSAMIGENSIEEAGCRCSDQTRAPVLLLPGVLPRRPRRQNP